MTELEREPGQRWLDELWNKGCPIENREREIEATISRGESIAVLLRESGRV